jgi:hypothetical protein
MPANDPRREIATKLELLEEETALKMNRDFTLCPDKLIAKGDLKLLRVFSETIQKAHNIEKAYDIMMSLLPQLSDNGEHLRLFDWFLIQNKDYNEVVSKINICIPFKTDELFNLQSYEACQFPMTLHSRAPIKDLTNRVESFMWKVQKDMKSLGNIWPAMFDSRFADIFVYTKGIREEDRD